METNQSLLFKALKSSVRRQILLELTLNDQPPGYFAFIYELSPAAITKHLKILEQAMLITRYRNGRERMCRLNKWGLAAMKVDWIVDLLL